MTTVPRIRQLDSVVPTPYPHSASWTRSLVITTQVDSCPACNQRRLYGLTYQHTVGCQLGIRCDSRQLADYACFGMGYGIRTRPMTDTEVTLLLSISGIAQSDLPTLVRLVRESKSVILKSFGAIVDARLA